jgi:hypothetical protein
MKIIYDNSGTLAQLIPAPKFLNKLEGTDEQKLIYVADKDLPTGTRYEIVEDLDVPVDRTFRNAWEYVSGNDEKTSNDLPLAAQLKHGQITQEDYDASNG